MGLVREPAAEDIGELVHGQVTIIFVVYVGLFVCAVFLSRL